MTPAVLSSRRYLGEQATSNEEVATPFFTLLLSDYDAVSKQGTDYASDFRNGSFTTQAGVISRFARAAANVILQLGDQSSLPANQRIRSARLIRYALVGDLVELTVELATADIDTKITATVSFSNTPA